MRKLEPANKQVVFNRSALKNHGIIDEGRVQILRDARMDLETRDEFSREIGALWSDAQKKFLAIGRYLVDAKAKLPRGEFESMIESDLPFGRNVAYQLRRVAEAVDQGRLSEPELPPSYNTIYYLATFSDSELAMARENGIVRPDVTVGEVKEFKRALADRSTETPRQAHLRKRRETLMKKLAKLQDELAEIERALGSQTGGN